MRYSRTPCLAPAGQTATPPNQPLSARAAHEASEVFALVARLAARGELATWNIAHADLAFMLMRLAADPLPGPARALLDAALARPAIRAYVDHPRPPNPPPYVRS